MENPKDFSSFDDSFSPNGEEEFFAMDAIVRKRKKSKGKGRCGENTLTAGGRKQSWSELDRGVIDPQTGKILPFSSWKELKNIRERFKEEGIDYQGEVVVTPRGQLNDPNAARSTEYMDESTIRGGYPQDCPQETRNKIGEFVSMVNASFDDMTSQQIREMKAYLGVKLREEKYQNTSTSHLFETARETFLFLRRFELTKTGIRLGEDEKNLWEVSKRSYLNYREITPADIPLVLAALNPSPNSKKEKSYSFKEKAITEETLRRFPTLANWDETGKLVDVTVFEPGEMENIAIAIAHCSTEGRMPLSPHLAGLITEEWLQERTKDEKLCYSCFETECQCTKNIPLSEQVKTYAKFDNSDMEHRWGKSHAVKLTPEMQQRAEEKEESVKVALLESLQNLTASNPENDTDEMSSRKVQLSAWVKTILEEPEANLEEALTQRYGVNITRNLALFLEQTGQSESFLEENLVPVLTILDDATRRAKNFHSSYADILYREFEDEKTKSVESATEIYLGRDGIFAYHARMAQLRTIKDSLPDSERNAREDESTQARYVIASRGAKWKRQEHGELLGENPVFVDTGFQGSIPENIIRAQTGQRPDTIRRQDSPPIRLFTSDIGSYGFQHGLPRHHAVTIEYDAKPTRSTFTINGGRPTSAVEQMVFRHLRDSITKVSTERTKEILKEKKMEKIESALDTIVNLRKNK